jgi:hypothetical protein
MLNFNKKKENKDKSKGEVRRDLECSSKIGMKGERNKGK